MNAKKSLIALSVFSILMGGVWEAAVAKAADKEDDSVRRWGRWAVLAPAAGQDEVGGFTTVQASNDLGSCQSEKNCPTIVIQQVEPESPCEAGMACGFARVDVDSETNDDYVASFKLDMTERGPEEEGVSTVAFVVDAGTLLNPGSTTEIDSDTEAAKYYSALVRTLNRQAQTVLRGDILRDEAGQKLLVQGLWQHADNSGEFAWGITATKDQMDIIRNANLIANYSGITANGGTASMQIDFGNSTWTGQFNGNNVTFSAAGAVVGSGFVSEAGGFSGNIAEGEVKGGFVNAGLNAIGGYEVVDIEGIKDADVFNTALRAEPEYRVE